MKAIRNVVTAAVVLFILIGTPILAHSMGLNVYEAGCLVPYATYNDTEDTTVGLIVWLPTGSIYWNYISADGVNLASDSIAMQPNIWNYAFSLRSSDGNSHPNTLGYLIFTSDNNGTLTTAEDTDNIYGNAVLLSVNDAAFLPVIPLARSDYANADLDLSNLNGASLVALSYGLRSTATHGSDTRYWINPALGAVTSLVIWTCQAAPASFDGTISSVTGVPFAVITMNPVHTHLNVFDVASEIAAIPAGFIEGSILVGPSGSDRLIYSIMTSTTFSAKQTLLGADVP
jgi:hypothetical protein